MNQVVTADCNSGLLPGMGNDIKRPNTGVASVGGAAPHMLIDGVKRLNTEASSSLGGAAPHMLVDGVKRSNSQAATLIVNGAAPHMLIDGVKRLNSYAALLLPA
jgi:hypothetical protein